MRKMNFLALFFAALFFAGFVAAIQEPPTCEIVEKPSELTVGCIEGNLTLVYYDEIRGVDKIESIRVLESPFSLDSIQFNEFQSRINASVRKDKENGIINHAIELQSPGKYLLEINEGQLVNVSFGEKFSQEEQSRIIIFLAGILLGAAAGVSGLWFIFSKRKPRFGLLLLAIGFILVWLVSGIVFV